MAITSIVRDWGVTPAIVRINTTDNLGVASGSGYLAAQAANIYTANAGPFEWLATDMVAVTASDGNGLFNISSDFTKLVMQAEGILLNIPITLAQLLAMYTTPIQLVGAPGLGNVNVFTGLELIQTYGTAALAGGGVVAVQYGSTAHGAGLITSTTHAAADLQSTASAVYLFSQVLTILPSATTANLGLYLSNLTGVFTGGTGSTFNARVSYSVVPVA